MTAMVGEHSGGEVGSAFIVVIWIELAEPRGFPAECLPSHGFGRNARAHAAVDQSDLCHFPRPRIEFPPQEPESELLSFADSPGFAFAPVGRVLPLCPCAKYMNATD